ncbi:hypothetical protein [Burkholderia sp. Ac-20353]|uniref:hypothetical protein n=1 Tax=Burkholderia sp. Ac-20353 TaxID=2703894 RepID=UPI00197B7A02|nr:hypothetical protein [Burkholderia sp. Ac-20353]MBN3788066.1 hypothetical protein [Burkholderia sp. Ac-20353]
MIVFDDQDIRHPYFAREEARPTVARWPRAKRKLFADSMHRRAKHPVRANMK